MKRNLTEEAKRILEIMGNIEGSNILNELNMEYLDQILDKVSSGGIESLDDYEKDALQKMSQDQEVNAPEKHSLGMTDDTLRFTTTDQNTGKLIVSPDNPGQTFGQARLENAYIEGEAREIAGYNEAIFIDGDLSQLDKPEEEQQIRMLTPQGEYECVATIGDRHGLEVYEINLKGPENDEPEIDDLSMLNEDMSQYQVYSDDPNIVKEVKDENGMRVYNTFDDLEEEEGFASQVDADADQMGDISEQSDDDWMKAQDDAYEDMYTNPKNTEGMGEQLPDDDVLLQMLHNALLMKEWGLVKDAVKTLRKRLGWDENTPMDF